MVIEKNRLAILHAMSAIGAHDRQELADHINTVMGCYTATRNKLSRWKHKNPDRWLLLLMVERDPDGVVGNMAREMLGEVEK